MLFILQGFDNLVGICCQLNFTNPSEYVEGDGHYHLHKNSSDDFWANQNLVI